LGAAVEAVGVAEALVKQAEQEAHEVRVGLGLPPQPENGDLTSVPKDINQTFSGVRQAVADLTQLAARVGLPLTRAEASPKEVLDEFRGRDPGRDIDRVVAKLIPEAPAMKQVDAKLIQARRELCQPDAHPRTCRG